MPRLSRLSALFLLICVASSAQTRRDHEPYCGAKSAKRVELTTADTTILGLTMGRASLKDVQAKLGNATVTRVSREEESDVAACYVSPGDGTVLVFYSGSMGGWKDITWFALWSREAAFPQASQCTPSELVSGNLSTKSGLRLGLSLPELKRIEGSPTKHGRELIKYEYICRSKMTATEIAGFKTANGWDVTKDPYFDRMSWIDVYFAKAAASRIEAGEIESY